MFYPIATKEEIFEINRKERKHYHIINETKIDYKIPYDHHHHRRTASSVCSWISSTAQNEVDHELVDVAVAVADVLEIHGTDVPLHHAARWPIHDWKTE